MEERLSGELSSSFGTLLGDDEEEEDDDDDELFERDLLPTFLEEDEDEDEEVFEEELLVRDDEPFELVPLDSLTVLELRAALTVVPVVPVKVVLATDSFF